MADFLRLTDLIQLKAGAYFLPAETTHVAIIKKRRRKLRIVFIRTLTEPNVLFEKGVIRGSSDRVKLFEVGDKDPDNGHVVCKISDCRIPKHGPFFSFKECSIEFLRLGDLPEGRCRHPKPCAHSTFSINSIPR